MIQTVKFVFVGGTEIYAQIYPNDNAVDFYEIEDAISSYLDSVNYGTDIQLVEDVLGSFPFDFTILCGDFSKVTPNHVFLV